MKTFYTTDAQNEDQAKDSLRADPHFIWNGDKEVRIWSNPNWPDSVVLYEVLGMD